MSYGSILKACRERAGLSQAELAEQLFINQSDVSKFERGSKEPSMSTFQKWATLTQSPDVLVAFIAGMDGLTILSNVLNSMSGVIGFIKFIY
ncbi:multiprotein-bridging factor 1 family protein [Sporosarcina sp. NPDC096371]|uniref:helix-turn-helix domain-containing protein n=1 Tax=Sporosarcina sp. NPDC096371 TaxID=3364530 RepID=UPI003809CD37